MQKIEELAQLARSRSLYLKEEKEKGVKIVGYTGRFVPEELIYASGAIPYLICRGGEPEPPEATLPYMLRFLNPFARSQIGYQILGVEPVIPILDLIVAQCSDCHESRLADLFEYFKLPTVRLGVPPDWKKSISVAYYRKGLARLVKTLEDLTGTDISDHNLKKSISTLNSMREILNKINLLRKQPLPPIGGYDFVRLNHLSYYCDPSESINRLEDLYSHLKTRKSPFPNDAPRLLLAGQVVAVGDYVVLKLIEDSGGVITTEFLDHGCRQYPWNVSTDGDLVRNIGTTYYLERTPPSIFQPAWKSRIEYMKKLIGEFNIEGVVWYQLSFEEIYNMECSVILKSIEDLKIPFLKLESSYEYAREAMGTLTTRIESFVETIRQRRSSPR